MNKNAESIAHFQPVMTAEGREFKVELAEHRDYFILSANVDGQIITVPGFDLRNMQEQLRNSIRHALAEDE
ncbi:hypothetical protein [Jeotgalibacillus sp. R-1-5s-1]|uniref:hypothetical protein n=1 Tax=Jeotgalibacillus sp. R-1-5s-1 TaxID=2555897 RepID=UPI00106A9116|nr:hypothetical protein [Jeotgalibacillus sp. R-1-5s-1]TFE03415.1 hypothetical protein E2491_01095 [Jeotgalibacillus sp. R-1-5s-1]